MRDCESEETSTDCVQKSSHENVVEISSAPMIAGRPAACAAGRASIQHFEMRRPVLAGLRLGMPDDHPFGLPVHRPYPGLWFEWAEQSKPSQATMVAAILTSQRSNRTVT